MKDYQDLAQGNAAAALTLAATPATAVAPVDLAEGWMNSLTTDQTNRMNKDLADLERNANHEAKYAAADGGKKGEEEVAFFKQEYEKQKATLMKDYQDLAQGNAAAALTLAASPEAPVELYDESWMGSLTEDQRE